LLSFARVAFNERCGGFAALVQSIGGGQKHIISSAELDLLLQQKPGHPVNRALQVL